MTFVSASHEYCEGDAFSKICAVGEVVVVNQAFYGRMQLGDCITIGDAQLGCRLDVLPILDAACSGWSAYILFYLEAYEYVYINARVKSFGLPMIPICIIVLQVDRNATCV